MILNNAQKSGLVVGGLSSLYLSVWSGMTLLDYIDELEPGYFDNYDNQEMNHAIAQTACLILPLTIATGMHIGLAITTAFTARNSQEYKSTMTAVYNNALGFFGLPTSSEKNNEDEQATNMHYKVV